MFNLQALKEKKPLPVIIMWKSRKSRLHDFLKQLLTFFFLNDQAQ